MRIGALFVAAAITAAAVVSAAGEAGPVEPGAAGPVGSTPVVAMAQPVRAAACARPRGPLLAYGHSYLHSPRIGGARANYATLAAAQLHVSPVTRAVDRATTEDVERLVRRGPTRWVPRSADLVVIDTGINDIERQVPAKRWTASLRRTLDAFAAGPVPTILLVRPLPVARAGHPGRDPAAVSRYAAAQRSVAEAYSAVRIVDASPGWNPKVHLALDGVHPNPAGMLHLAGAVGSSAQRAFCRP